MCKLSAAIVFSYVLIRLFLPMTMPVTTHLRNFNLVLDSVATYYQKPDLALNTGMSPAVFLLAKTP